MDAYQVNRNSYSTVGTRGSADVTSRCVIGAGPG
jgi:hypothetical protein